MEMQWKRTENKILSIRPPFGILRLHKEKVRMKFAPFLYHFDCVSVWLIPHAFFSLQADGVFLPFLSEIRAAGG